MNVAIAVTATVMWTTACGRQSTTNASPKRVETNNAKSFDPTVEPTSKQIVGAALSIRDWPLKDYETCAGSGTSLDDSTIGDYFSGWLSEFDTSGKNWIETSTKKAA